MAGTRGRWWGVAVLVAGLLTPAAGRAWPTAGWCNPPGCPKPCYSPFHYWTPQLYRVYACCHNPHEPIYAVDRCPEIQPGYQVQTFPCPPVPPAALYGPAKPPAPAPAANGAATDAEKAPEAR